LQLGELLGNPNGNAEGNQQRSRIRSERSETIRKEYTVSAVEAPSPSYEGEDIVRSYIRV